MGHRSGIPLPAGAYRDLIDAVQTREMPENARLAILLMLVCGLRVGEAVHARADWFTEGDNGLELRIPDIAKCYKEGGCSPCKSDNSRHDNPERWGPKTQGRQVDELMEPHMIPVMDEFTDHLTGESRQTELPELVRWYFKKNDAVGLSSRTVGSYLARCADDAGIEFVQGRGKVEKYRGNFPDIINHDCRASWAVQCKRSEIDDTTIMDWAGWQDSRMLNRYAKFVDDPEGKNRESF